MMDKNLALNSFTQVRTGDLGDIKKWGTKEPELSKGSNEIIDAGSKIADAIAVYGYAQSLPHSLKIVKCCLNTFRLADDWRRVRSVESNLDSLYKVRKVVPLDNKNDAYNDITFKYFYSNYDEYKKGIRELDRKYVLNKWKICLLEEELSMPDVEDREKKEMVLRKLCGINRSIERRVSRKQCLKERIINNEAISINKNSEKRLFWKFGADLLSFAANIIEVFTFPVVATFLLACKTPGMIYGICRKIYRNEDILTREVNMKEDYILTTLQLPALVADFWNVIDKWIFKKIRKKSDDARKEQVLNKQLGYIEEKISKLIGNDIFSKMKNIEDIGEDENKQKELIEEFILIRDKQIQERTIQELESIREKISDMQLNMELDKDIEKQRKRLTKIENEIINKAGRGPKHNEFTEERRNDILEEVIRDIETKMTELEIGEEGLKTLDLVFKQSKKTEEVIGQRPSKWYLKHFNLRTMEDEDKMRSIAKFIVNHIKELPDVDNLSEEERKEFTNNEIEIEKSYKRMEEMLKTLNVDGAGDFIKRIRNYRMNKGTVGAESKNDIIDDLIEKMKKEI